MTGDIITLRKIQCIKTFELCKREKNVIVVWNPLLNSSLSMSLLALSHPKVHTYYNITLITLLLINVHTYIFTLHYIEKSVRKMRDKKKLNKNYKYITTKYYYVLVVVKRKYVRYVYTTMYNVFLRFLCIFLTTCFDGVIVHRKEEKKSR